MSLEAQSTTNKETTTHTPTVGIKTTTSKPTTVEHRLPSSKTSTYVTTLENPDVFTERTLSLHTPSRTPLSTTLSTVKNPTEIISGEGKSIIMLNEGHQ